jgi:hypothetical protein
MRSLASGFTTGLLALCLVSFGLAAPLLAAGAPHIGWSRQFGTDTSDEATAVAVDGSHNVFVGGNTGGDLFGPNAGLWDGFLRKYDYQGTVLWTTQFGTRKDDKVYDVTTDGSGGAYVVGYTGPLSRPAAHDTDAYVRRYDASGGLLWAKTFGTQADDSAWGVAVDRSGNAYVGGWTAGSLFAANAGDADVFLCKYDASNNLVWGRQVGSAGWDWSPAHCVALDASGNIYIGGMTTGDLGGPNPNLYRQLFLIKYTPEGDLAWKKQYAQWSNSSGGSLAANAAGKIGMTGEWNGALANRLDTGGNVEWTTSLDFLGNGIDTYGCGLALDAGGGACIAGGVEGGNGRDVLIWGLDASGKYLWHLLQSTMYAEEAYDVAVDSWDRIYVVGWTDGSLFGVNPSPGCYQAFVEVLPEPATLSLLALGALALLGRRRA